MALIVSLLIHGDRLMRILLIEDDHVIASFVKKGLVQEGYSVELASDGELGFHLFTQQNYDAAIVDIMLPRLDGISLVESIRSQNIRTPVIFLSAKREVEDRIKGLRAGGDDYLVKPFAFAELLARLQSLIRRSSEIKEAEHLKFGDLHLDLVRHKLFRQGKFIELQPREMALIEYFMRNAGRVVSRTMIIENVWDYQIDVETNVVEACVCRLRNKINEGFDEKIIKTIRGVGYVLECSE